MLAKSVIVHWFVCCIPIKLGGLGSKNLINFNNVLQCKMAWKLQYEDSFVYCFFRAHLINKLNPFYYVSSSMSLALKDLYHVHFSS